LRFYVALQCEGIRPHESPDEPQSIVLEGPEWEYSRQAADVSESFEAEHRQDASGTQQSPQGGTPISANSSANLIDEPIKCAAAAGCGTREASASDETSCASALTMELAQTIAQYLMLSKNKQKHEPYPRRTPRIRVKHFP